MAFFATQKPPKWGFQAGLVESEWAWFWRWCRFAIVFWENGGAPIDLVTGQVATVFSGAPTWSMTSDGPASEIDSIDGWQLAHHPSYNLIGEMSIIWRGVIDTGSAFRHFAGKHATGGGTNNPFDFRTSNAASPKASLTRATAAGANTYAGPVLPLGKLFTIAVSQNTLVNGDVTFYLDGVPSAGVLTGGASSFVTGNTEPLLFGRRADGVVQLDGRQSLLCGFQKGVGAGAASLPLTDVQHLQFAHNPFGPFRMADEVGLFVPAAAVGFVPYPNPRYVLTGGMQSMDGGV